MPNGEIQEEFQMRLHAVGEWLAKYGDSIYGTRGGPLAPADWGVTTQKGNKIYVHVLKVERSAARASAHRKTISGAQELVGGAKVEVTQSANGVVLKLPAVTKNETDRVVVLSVN